MTAKGESTLVLRLLLLDRTGVEDLEACELPRPDERPSLRSRLLDCEKEIEANKFIIKTKMYATNGMETKDRFITIKKKMTKPMKWKQKKGLQ